MAVYVDELFDTEIYKSAKWKYKQACHMFVETLDDLEELHHMADAICLLRSWYQGPPTQSLPHYDLTPRKRLLAIAQGAIPLTPAEANAKMRKYFTALHEREREN